MKAIENWGENMLELAVPSDLKKVEWFTEITATHEEYSWHFEETLAFNLGGYHDKL